MREVNKATQNAELSFVLAAATFVAMIAFAVQANAQINQESEPELTASIEPLRAGVTEDQIFAELVAHNELRKAALLDYTARRTY